MVQKFCGNVICPKLCENCASPQNFHAESSLKFRYILQCFRAHFPLYNFWENLKIRDFLTFSGVWEMEHWWEMGRELRMVAWRSFIWCVRKTFRKINISYPLIRTRTCAYQGVRNVSFSENFAYVLNEWSLGFLIKLRETTMSR